MVELFKHPLDLMGRDAASGVGHTNLHGAGCENCVNTGFCGRIGIFETLVPNETMRELMETNASVSVIRGVARNVGYRTLREDGIVRIMQGVTTVEEVIRVTS